VVGVNASDERLDFAEPESVLERLIQERRVFRFKTKTNENLNKSKYSYNIIVSKARHYLYP
jgi:hypothetical protein